MRATSTIKTMRIPLFHVDAFTTEPFTGNPAAVCPLQAWLDDETLRKVAAENNLSETAFFVPGDSGHYELRWFTPRCEVRLCGHATLASAYVVLNLLEPGTRRSAIRDALQRHSHRPQGRRSASPWISPRLFAKPCAEPSGRGCSRRSGRDRVRPRCSK